jgi:U3 small nucleolar RNA-associated protein 18
MGVGGVVAELKSGRGGTVAAMTWGEGGKVLNVLGGRDGAEVESWNVGERKVLGKWKDDRAFGGSLMKNSKDGLYTAVG